MSTIKPSVSVVIPAYQCAATIALTLHALGRQTYDGPMEVIVVDDGSTDETADIVKSFSGATYVYQPNAGPAVARNKGAGLSGSQIILFTDSDCIPHDNWVQASVSGFRDKHIAAVAGSYDIANAHNLLARCIYHEIVFRHQKIMPRFPRSFGSYNVAIWRSVFTSLGGFDPSYRYPSGEDNDLSYKLLGSGFKIFFEPKSLVQHFFPSKIRVYLKEQFRHGFWRVKLYKDHPQMLAGDDYTFWKDITEPLLVLLSVLGLALGFFNASFFKFLFLPIVFFLFLIEIYYGLIVTKAPRSALFFSYVMLLRAYARSLGFITGFILIFAHFRPKKNQ